MVTSADTRLARARLSAAGLPQPPALVTADDVDRPKPDPEGFLAAARALGADPTRSLVVEDAPAGVAAGVASGARVLLVGDDAVDISSRGRHPLPLGRRRRHPRRP